MSALGITIYTAVIAVMLISFACGMNGLVMRNVTTNENIRKRWNAKNNSEGI